MIIMIHTTIDTIHNANTINYIISNTNIDNDNSNNDNTD